MTIMAKNWRHMDLSELFKIYDKECQYFGDCYMRDDYCGMDYYEERAQRLRALIQEKLRN